MANKFESPKQENKEEPLIKVVSPVGAEGRKISKGELDKAQRTITELKFEKEIKKKQREGVLLSKEETAKLRELKTVRELAQGKGEEKTQKEKIIDLIDIVKEGPKEDLKKDNKKTENKQEEPLIKVVSPVGAEGRKISKKELDKSQRTIDELNFEKEIKRKQKEGVLLSKEETAKLRELETARKVARGEGEEKKGEDEIIELTEDMIVKSEVEGKSKQKDEKVSIETREVQINRYKEDLEKLRKERDELANEDGVENKGQKLRNLNSEIIELEDKLNFFKTEQAEKSEDSIEKKETKELILDDVRREYARADLNAEKYLKEHKGKNKNDFEGYEEAKSAYLEALKNQRLRMYKEAIKEVEGLCFPESEKKEETEKIKEKMEEIVKETIVKEANRLYDQKMDLKLEAKEGSGKAEKMKKFAGKIVEKYRKMPLSKKLLISGGLLAGGLFAGAAGGATGAALVTGIVAGKWAQRVLGGAATAVGLEALIKRSQEKKEGKETLKELADRLQDSIKNNDGKLDEKLLKLEGGKKGQKNRRYIVAGAAGVLVGSGLVGKALNNVIGGIWGGEGTEKIAEQAGGTEKIAEQTQVEGTEKIIGQVPAEGFIETVGEGDSVWKMAEDQLEKQYGEKFVGLDKATQTHLIDAVKDKVAENPEKFGLEDIDKLKVGQKVDFSGIFEDKGSVDKMFGQAGDLVDSEKASILSNNNKIEEWVSGHPGEELTSGKVDEILGVKTEVTPDTELADVEKSMVDQERATTEQAALETRINEAESKLIESLGFVPDEYNAIQSVKVSYLLEQLPSEFESWEMWRNTPVTDIELPHDGVYGSGEFGRQIGLAEYIRSLSPDEGAKQMTVRQFMRTIANK